MPAFTFLPLNCDSLLYASFIIIAHPHQSVAEAGADEFNCSEIDH